MAVYPSVDVRRVRWVLMISSLARAQPSLSTDLYQVSWSPAYMQAPIQVQRELLFNIAIWYCSALYKSYVFRQFWFCSAQVQQACAWLHWVYIHSWFSKLSCFPECSHTYTSLSLPPLSQTSLPLSSPPSLSLLQTSNLSRSQKGSLGSREVLEVTTSSSGTWSWVILTARLCSIKTSSLTHTLTRER